MTVFGRKKDKHKSGSAQALASQLSPYILEELPQEAINTSRLSVPPRISKPLPSLPKVTPATTNKSYISHLPPELLILIFTSTLSPYNSPISRRQSPLLLTCICSSWRTLSLSLPELWSSIHIVAPFVDYADLSINKRRAKIVETWLERSGELGLSISLGTYGHTFPINSPHLLLETLIKFASRWEHVSFHIAGEAYFPLSSLRVEDVPRLQSVQLLGYKDHPIYLTIFDWMTTPSISSVTLKNVQTVLPPFGNITHLCVMFDEKYPLDKWLTCEGALGLLKDAPRVESCTLWVLDSREPLATLSSIRMAKMEALTICVRLNRSSASSSRMQIFFQQLEMPTLRSLSVQAILPAGLDITIHLPIEPLLRRTERSILEHLHFSEVPIHPDALIDCITSFHALRSLHVQEQDKSRPIFAGEIIQLLTDNVGVIPDLEKLVLENCSGHWTDFHQLILARRLVSACLKMIIVTFRSRSAVDDLATNSEAAEMLDLLRSEEGMVIEFWFNS